MATIDDLLVGLPVTEDINEAYYINPITRENEIPADELILGTNEDDKSECKFFRIPKVIGNDIHVMDCDVRIYYQTAAVNVQECYVVKELIEQEDCVVFYWEIASRVVCQPGEVEFSVGITKSVDGVIEKAWNTVCATAIVLQTSANYLMPEPPGSKLDVIARVESIAAAADESKDAAQQSAVEAADHASTAAAEANKAASAAAAASASATMAEAATSSAEAAASAAARSASAAATSATEASTAASTANSKAVVATSKASEAATSANVAANSASSAQAAANAAATSANAAANSASTAQSAAEILQPEVNQLRQDIAAVSAVCGTLENTEDGTVIQLTDCAERPLKGLRIFGRTVQDGTPTPEAPVELVSVGDNGNVVTTVLGKNLAIVSGAFTNKGITHTVDATGQIISVGTLESGYNYTDICPYIHPNFNMVGTFTLSVNKVLPYYLGMKIRYIDNTQGEFGLAVGSRSKKFTISKEVKYYYFFFGNIPVGSDVNLTYTLQLEFGGDATDYEPCITPQTLSISAPNGLPGIPVTSGGNYTDSNGQQWICAEVDFARGKYVKRVKTATENGDHVSKSGAGDHIFAYTIGDCLTADVKYHTPYCDCYKYVATYDAANMPNYYFQLSTTVGTWNAMRFRDDRFSTVEEAKAYLSQNPFTLQYILATPVETDLSPAELAAYAALNTYKPNTTIHNTAGAWMEVSYQADTKLYIDKQFAELRNAIVSLGGNI